jgi:AraC-like DNA-binding protein
VNPTNHCKYIPQPPLSAFVLCFWYWQGAPETHSKERLLPNGEVAIIFNLRDDPIRVYDAEDITRYSCYGSAVVSGARSNCFVIDTSQEERVIGIEFRPGGASPFFRMPVSEAENTAVSLEDLWSRCAGEIRERLLAAPSVGCMMKTLERCLFEQLARPLELHPAVSHALEHFRRSGYSSRVTAITERIGMSSRRFIQLFHAQVGLTPKTFCRVRRFQHVLRSIHDSREAVNWAQIALDCGYYDQAHFIHDFQAFSGMTPTSYVAVATPHLNHVPLS